MINLREMLGKRALVVFVIGAGTFFFASKSGAQSYLSQVGNNTFSTQLPVELGNYDASTGNLHLQIPLGTWPQRVGHTLNAALVYDSRIWYISGNSWQPGNLRGSQGGWRFLISGSPGTVNYMTQVYQCATRGEWSTFSNFVWTAPDGTIHQFPITTKNDHYDCDGGSISSRSAYANDSSGYYMSVTNYTSATVFAPDGSQVYPSFKDTNGNYYSTDSNGNIVDTLGRTPVKVTTDCNNNSSETCYDVLNDQGSYSRYTVVNTTVSVSTAFHQSGITEYSGSIPVISTITLPDNKYYSFAYDYTTYGELTGVTLPTGGLITYTWTTYFDTFNNANRWLYTRTSGGGTWTYAPVNIGAPNCDPGYSYCQKVTVTKPSGDEIEYDFDTNSGSNGSWLADIIYRQGTAQLRSVVVNWTSGPTNVQKLSVTTAEDDSVGIEKTTEYTYVSSSLPFFSKISEWNYYRDGNLPATPDRITTFSSYCDASPGNITVTNGAGTQTVAQTNTTFDSYGSGLISLTGITHHDDTNFGANYTTRCNPTSISKLVSGTTYLTTSMTYDTTGQVRSITDPNNNATTLDYADNFYNDAGDNTALVPYTPSPTNAYLTTATLPIIGAQTFGYYYGTGQLALSTDQNSATTTYHYYDPFNRPTATLLPDGGWDEIAYASSETETDSYLGITDGTPSTSCSSGCRHDEIVSDDLGRLSDSDLVNDPDGETTVATSYDSNSRVSSETNPYRTTVNGQDSYTYDGLDRVTQITHTDGTAIDVYYGYTVGSHGGIGNQLCSSVTYGWGYPALTIDEAGRKREVWTNGFGKTIEVDEPDPSNNLTKDTCYGYDLNDILTSVLSATGQTRTYAFDDLTRLTSVATPETFGNSTTYSYTTGTGLCSGNPNSVCSRTDPRGVTTTYTYDGLNRVTSITHSDGTPTVTYCYDGNNSACISGGYSSLYGKGRRSAMSDGSGNTGWSYDSVGRVKVEQRTITGITKTISYSYNFDGSIAAITYPSGRIVSYNIGNAERPLSVTDSNGTQYAVTANYSAAGALSAAIYGKVTGGFGGATENRQYNNRLELTSIQASSSNGSIINLAPCFTAFTISSNTPCSISATGNNGGVTGIANSIDSSETQAFAYDNLNRISSGVTKSTSGNDCWGQDFAIDSVANLTGISLTQCSGGSLSVTTDGDNHLVATGYSYDNAGDMKSDGAHTYFYDAEGRITQVDGTEGNCSTATACYIYDGDGLRVEKSSGTLYWRSIAGDVLAESDLQGNIQNEYVFFASRRIARISGSTVDYFYSDALGTTHTITDATAHPCYDANFTPYGQEVPNPNIPQTCSSNYKFTGYEYDPETGNYYAFARYYSSRLGRFMTPDPAPGSPDNCQSLNLYAYTSNIPTSFSDPTGLDPCPLVVAGTGDNPQNSKAILDFAHQIGANVVFPSPSMLPGVANDLLGTYSSEGISATEQGILASSGPDGGPTSVITFSVGAGYYNQAMSDLGAPQNWAAGGTVWLNLAPANIAYVMPYMPMELTNIMGAQSTTFFAGTGFLNDWLQGPLDLEPPGTINLGEAHSQNQVFPTLLQHLPFYPGPKCKHRKIIVGGGGGGSGYNDEFCLYFPWTCTWTPED